jgi:DNA-binding transcriptional regulator YiaG
MEKHPAPDRMSPAEFRRALDSLRLTTGAFARILKVNPRTVRRWQEEGHEGPSERASQTIAAMMRGERV